MANTYTIIFASVAAGMLLLLGGFLTFVKEKKLDAKCQEICKEYGIKATLAAGVIWAFGKRNRPWHPRGNGDRF